MRGLVIGLLVITWCLCIQLCASDEKVLNLFKLKANPFRDTNAEHFPDRYQNCLHEHVPIRDLDPKDQRTVIVFSKRGSGKTTTRQQLIQKFAHLRTPVFHVNVTSHLVIGDYLENFRRKKGIPKESWNRLFEKEWTSNDFAQMVVSIGYIDLIKRLAKGEIKLPRMDDEESSLRQPSFYSRVALMTWNMLGKQ